MAIFQFAKPTLWQTNIAMENHDFQWVNPLFLWPFSIAMLPSGYVKIAIEKASRNSGVSHEKWWIFPLNMVIFHRNSGFSHELNADFPVRYVNVYQAG